MRKSRLKQSSYVGASPRKSINEEPIQQSVQEKWYVKHCEKVKHNQYNLQSLDLMFDSIPYKFSISSFNRLKITRKEKKSQLSIKVSASFISKQKKSNLSNTQHFFIEIDFDNKGVLNVIQPGIVYYHSKINRNNKDVAILLEFTLIQKYRQNHHVTNMGYSLIDPFLDVHQDVGFIKKGNWSKNQKDITGIQFKYSINFIIQLKNLPKIIPQNTIVNCNRNIPCLSGETLPNTIKKAQILLQRSSSLYFKEFQIILPSKFQSDIRLAVEKSKQNFCREDRSSRVTIKKRFARLGFHNGWTMVSQIKKELQFEKDEKKGKKEGTRLKFIQNRRQQDQNEIEVWKGVEGVFICALLYEMQLEGKDYKQVMEFQVALFIRSLQSKQRFGDIQDTMIMGPGYGINSNILKLPCQQPLINFEYTVQELAYNSLGSNYTPIRSIRQNNRSPLKNKQFISQSRSYIQNDDDFYRAQDQKIKLEQNLNLLKSMHEIKQEQKKRLALQLTQQRQQYFDTQQRMQNDVTLLTKDQVSMQYQIKQLQQKLRQVEFQRQQQKLQRQQQNRIAIVQKQKILDIQRNTYNKPGTKVFIKNKREVEVSSMLYEALQKKFITPIIKNSDAVDPSEYDQFKVASKFVINFLSIRWDQPKSLYIVIRFFNIAGFRTSTIKQSLLQRGQGKLIKESLANSQIQNEAMYEFIIDPSLSTSPQSLQTDLVNYLWKKNLILDVYDAQNHFYLGQLNFGLKDLLRGKKDRIISVKQHLLVFNGKPICSIHIMITNQVIDCRRQGALSKTRVIVLSTTALSLPTTFKQSILEGALRQSISKHDKRLQMIKKSKQLKLLDNVSNNNIDPHQKQSMLHQIQQYKNQNKTNFMKQVYFGMLNEHKKISCYFGKAEVLNYTFTNTQPKTTQYRVIIQDPDENQFTIPQLSLINKAIQWRHFCQVKSFSFPKSFETISTNNTFKLAPNQSLEMLFKFITYRRASGYGEQLEIKQRMINILIMNISTNSLSSGFTLKIQPHQQVIDRSLIMYQNADQPVQLIFPLLNQLPKSAIIKPHLVSTYIQSTASWVSQYQLSVKVKSLPLMNRLIFHVLIYDNEYLENIKQNWRVQLNSYQGISLVCKQNSPVKFRLAIPQHFCNRNVNLYVSSSEVSFLQNVTNGFFTAENSVTVISGQAVNPSNERKSVLAHLVDSQSLQLLYGWKLNILPWSFRTTFT